MWNFCQITMSCFGLIDVKIIVSEKEQSDARTHAHRTHVCLCDFFCNSQFEKEQPVKTYVIVEISLFHLIYLKISIVQRLEISR